MSDTYVEGDPPSIAATTRALAAVLVESADALGSDDLAAVITAVSAVRAAAFNLERSFAKHGWGGGPLFDWESGDRSGDGDAAEGDKNNEHDELEVRSHPLYVAHFTDPIYTDEAGEFAPFGNDEGADAFLDLAGDRRALERGSLAYVFRDDAELANHELSKPATRRLEDLYLRVIAWGFGLIRLTGQIDSDGLDTLKIAVRRQAELWGDRAPEYQRMLADLQTFPNEPRSAPRDLP